MQPVRMAVVGLGFMGSTHWKAMRGDPGITVNAIYSQDARKQKGDLSAIKGNIGGPGEVMDVSGITAYHDIDALLADAKVDAVDLCLPTNLHESVAVAALRAGKHVLVEKPMALDGASADRMIAEADRAGRILMTAQVLRFWPEYMALYDAVRGDRLGAPRFAVFRRRCAAPGWSTWLGDAGKSGGGVFDLLIHDVDMCLHLFGPPTAVTAGGYEDLPRGIDCISTQFFYANRPAVLVTGGWHHPGEYPFSAEFTVSFDRATMEFSSAGRQLAVYGEGSLPALAQQDGYAGEIRYFAECVRTGRAPELCPPRESAAAVKLARLMLESRNQNGKRLECLNLV